MFALMLLAGLMGGPAYAQEASAETSEKKATEGAEKKGEGEAAAPTAEEGAEKKEALAEDAPEVGAAEKKEPTPDPAAAVLSPEAAEQIAGLQEVPAAQSAGNFTYQEGYLSGMADGKLAKDYGVHGLAGFAGGTLCACVGCLGVTAAEYMVDPPVPTGTWQQEEGEYQRGYIDGYRGTVRNRRMAYAFAGGTVGFAVSFGVGVALGAVLW